MNTRIRASRWILHNIPAPFQLTLDQGGTTSGEPVSAPDGLVINAALPYLQPFTPTTGGLVTSVVIPHAALLSGEKAALSVAISNDPGGQSILAQTIVDISAGLDP